MNKITIESFQGGLSLDRNSGNGSFWNSRCIQYRKNRSYIELSMGVTSVFNMDAVALGIGPPNAVAYWGTTGNYTNDLVVISGNGKIVTPLGGVTFTMSTGSGCVNIAEVNGNRYILAQGYLHQFISTTSVTPLVSFGTSVTKRPVLDFYGDMIIGDGKQVCRYNKDTTLISYSTTTEAPVIGGLAGDVVAITQIGPNVYVWCTDFTNTYLYIWDGLSGRPSQKIEYKDVGVRNVAILGNQHYWWGMKGPFNGNTGIRYVFVGDSYQPTLIAKSDYPTTPLITNKDGDKNRMAIKDNEYGTIGSIETINDMVILPGAGDLFTVGQYFPNAPYSLCREFTYPNATGGGDIAPYYITTGSTISGGGDISGLITFLYTSASNIYKVGIINLGQVQSGGFPNVIYQDSGFLETLEYIAPVLAIGEDNKKITIPFYLPHSSTSIECLVSFNQGAYTTFKTIGTTEYGVGMGVAEVPLPGKWRTIQFKFNLITSNTTYSPRLYTGITNVSTTIGKMEI